MSTKALIGYSGFVGSSLARQCAFDAHFNTANIDTINGQHFETVVCAAAPGSMFTANRKPERDRAQIDALIERLDAVHAQRFVLISSIAVLEDFGAGDDESTHAFQRDLAYGRHRRGLEAFCENRFDDCLVVRLPALFGFGIRKNFVFDLLNPVPTMLCPARLEKLLEQVPPSVRDVLFRLYAPDDDGMYMLDRHALNANPDRSALEEAVRATDLSATQFHNPATTYQYYDISSLWRDIGIATRGALRHIHLVTEPLTACAIHKCLLGADMPQTGAPLHHEDVRTMHAELWGRESPYLADASAVLQELAKFCARQKRTR